MSNDLSAFFAQDDATFDLPIMGRNPDTGEEVDTGVVFHIRSLKNPDSNAIVKKHRNKLFGKRMLEKGAIDDEEIGALTFMEATDPSDEQLAACVTSWDWGDRTFGNLDLKHSQKNVVAVFKAAPWIRSQVLQKAIAITDFTRA
jgi:hypothetical protein